MFYYTGKSNKKQSKNTAHGVLRAVLASAFAAGLLAMLLVSFFALLSASGCAAEKLSSLRTFAGAHTGVYECEAATLNGADLLERLKRHKFDLDIYYRALTREAVSELHAAGVKVNCWTCDDPAEAKKLIGWGVDMITTNILQ